MKHNFIRIFIASVFLLGLVFRGYSTPIKVFILSGQSNMVGYGKVNGTHLDRLSAPCIDPSASPPDPTLTTPFDLGDISQYTFPIPFYVAIETKDLRKWEQLMPGEGGLCKYNYYTFGPEIGIARKLTNKYPNDKFIFIKIACGATTLSGNWLNNERQNPQFDVVGTYTWFKTRISEALGYINAREQVKQNGYTISGMLWMQGESDGAAFKPDGSSNVDNAMAYSKNLADFVEKVRKDIYDLVKTANGAYPANPNPPPNPNIPFAYGKIKNARWTTGDRAGLSVWPYGLNVQIGQYRAQAIPCTRCTDGTSNAAATVWASESSVDPDGATNYYMKCHYDTRGVYNVGLALGQAMVDLLENKTKPKGCSDPVVRNWEQLLLE
jgi:hypothetical protein